MKKYEDNIILAQAQFLLCSSFSYNFYTMGLVDKYAQPMQEELHVWAVEHAEASKGLLVALDNEPEQYTNQRMRVNTIPGTPLEPGIIDSIAKDVDPRYVGVSRAIEENKNAPALDLMHEILQSRQNVVLGTDHQELIDAALILAKVTTYLRNQAQDKHGEDLDFDSAILANKMIAWLGVNLNSEVIPVTDLLAMVFNMTYMSIPNTRSAKEKLSVPARAITEYNSKLIIHSLAHRLRASHSRREDKAQLLAVVLSGTIEKPLDLAKSELDVTPPDGGEVYVLGRANTGMLRFLGHALTMLACSKMNGEEIKVALSDKPLGIRSAKKLNIVMAMLTEQKNQNDPNNLYIYDKDNNLPVIRPN